MSNNFLVPRLYLPINRRPVFTSPSQTQATLTRDNNLTPQAPTTPTRHLPPVPPFPSAAPESRAQNLLPTQELALDLSEDFINEIPAVLLHLVHSITQTLRNGFIKRPPHTIQRLAELLLYPTKHYKTLPAYLRAMDRIVSVSSTADIFPLSEAPAIVNGVNGDGGLRILWNNNDTRNGYDGDSLGSDESLGGALLTPIPWLRNGISSVEDSGEHLTQHDSNSSASSDGLGEPISLVGVSGNGDPLVPERVDGAVTQGELMRIEQEAGVVPLTQNREDTSVTRTMIDADGDDGYLDESEVIPHARGPDVVGSVDMGRVDGKDVELHIGSPPTGEPKHGTDPNNAQDVLTTEDSQDNAAASTVTGTSGSTTGATSTADSDDFEIVHKESADEEDAMQLDDAISSMTTKDKDAPVSSSEPTSAAEEQDGDIVLVDADGKTEDDDDDDDDGANKDGASAENGSSSAAAAAPTLT